MVSTSRSKPTRRPTAKGRSSRPATQGLVKIARARAPAADAARTKNARLKDAARARRLKEMARAARAREAAKAARAKERAKAVRAKELEKAAQAKELAKAKRVKDQAKRARAKEVVRAARGKAAAARVKGRASRMTRAATSRAKPAVTAAKPRSAGRAAAPVRTRVAKPSVRNKPTSKKIDTRQAAGKASADQGSTVRAKRVSPPVPRPLAPAPAKTRWTAKSSAPVGVAETPARTKETKPAVDPAIRERELAREIAVVSVNRALDLLEVLARGGPQPLAILAETARCGKNAATEALATLQARNFVIQDEAHGLWRLGARWAVLGSAASEQGALAATAMPFLIALGQATGENVYMRVRDRLEVETAAIYQTDPNLRIYTEVGKKMPLHAGSGRLLLAHAPEAVQTQVLAQRLQRYTPSTRIDPTWIAAELHRIRQRGFLITDSEVVAGTVTVGAPVRDASGQVVAVMLIAAPSLRMRPPRPRALLPAVVDAARKLSEALGAAAAPQPAPATTQTAAPPPVKVVSLVEQHRQTDRPAQVWPAAAPVAAMGSAIARPHSIFR